jgi:GntR family transcriptional repressor for pyruvate dehydrogenase complex
MDLQQETNLLYLMTVMEKTSFEGIVAVRKILEISSAELAAQNRSREDLDSMYSCLEKMNTPDIQTKAKEDADLHMHIAAASGNPLLKCLLHIIGGYISRIATGHWALLMAEKQLNAADNFMTQHRRIVEAIEAGHSKTAMDVMSAHMDGLIDSIAKYQSSLKDWSQRELGL